MNLPLPTVFLKPEVLSPAGDWECARAAVENGADAIYFGVGRFNARVRAHNFTLEDLPRLMAWLHGRGVKGYVTFNTLVFTGELREAEEQLRQLISAGVDAVIVQDVGICRLVKALQPDCPIHISTQMTLTSAAGLALARELGASLVVLARECPISEIAALQSASGEPALPLEVFVHGALCVAYSGQCLTSEALGGRSANRGECAQACRMPYDLLRDGQPVDLGDRRYLLSPRDLASVEVIPDLIRAGVRSLKIEGRLKSPEYVAAITRVYRRAVDTVMEALTGPHGPSNNGSQAASEAAGRVLEECRYEMEMAFSRGLFTGWLRGIDNQSLVHGRFGTKRGVFLGRIEKIDAPHVWLTLEGPLKEGDGVVFDAGRPEDGEEGGRVHALDPDGRWTRLRFRREDLDWHRLAPGHRLWKTNDPALDKRLRQTFAGDRPRHLRPLAMEASGRAGETLRVVLKDEAGRQVEERSAVPLVPAAGRPLDEEILRTQLGRLGGTPFFLERLENHLPPGLHLPVSELNRLRRTLVERLTVWRQTPPPRPLPNDSVVERMLGEVAAGGKAMTAAPGGPELIPLVRSLPVLEAMLAAGARTIYAELEDPKAYREAVRMVRQAPDENDPRREIWVAPPRIFKTGEDWILRIVCSAGADGYLARNPDHLFQLAGQRLRGDFSLNVANPLTARYFLERFDLERVTASYDLNIQQLTDLLNASPPSWYEVTIHQHMPMFHMEHCVFCAFLTNGKDYRDCGRPCDRLGLAHPVKADAGCRNTVFNARAQTGAEYAAHLRRLGVQHFRIEFLDQSPDLALDLYRQYRRLLDGEVDGPSLWRQFNLHNQLGVTRGTLA